MSSWQIPSHLPALKTEVIHVWQANVVTLAPCERYFASLLDDDERARGNRFHAAPDRLRHVVSRGVLRSLAANYLDVDARTLRFELGAFGKPRGASIASADLGFNVSHSGDVVLLVFARNGDVGVDVEHWNTRLDDIERARLAQSVFSVEECEVLRMLPFAERERAFYAIWSRKEAYLKGTGAGISAGLAHFDVSANDDARLIADRSCPANIDRWGLHDIDVGVGYSAALAATLPHRRVEHWVADPSLFTVESRG